MYGKEKERTLERFKQLIGPFLTIDKQNEPRFSSLVAVESSFDSVFGMEEVNNFALISSSSSSSYSFSSSSLPPSSQSSFHPLHPLEPLHLSSSSSSSSLLPSHHVWHGVCNCLPSFSGLDCSLHLCPSSCSDHGSCNYKNGNCTCFPGFIGNVLIKERKKGMRCMGRKRKGR